MTAFKSKPSGSTVSSGNRSVQSLPAQGPITKVKERSIRSVPMGRARSTERATPDSTFSDEGFKSSSRLPRKSSAGPGRGSQPGSRTGSKPPSRASSNASLDSTDEGSRIPIRRTGSLKRGSPASARTPLASSTPVSRTPFSLNTRPEGSSLSRGRSPSAGAGDRTRTPSGSSVSFNLGSGSRGASAAAGSHSTYSTSTSASASASQGPGGTTRTSNLSRKTSGSSELYTKKSTFSRDD